jgi:pimeloyl-ACP methyl ester carboxylesterase
MHPLIIKSKNEKLLGSYFKAAGKENNPLLILLHGFPGNETNFDIAHAVRRFGINVAVFHYRGSWGSGGSFSISNSLSDVSSVIDHFSDKEISKQ